MTESLTKHPELYAIVNIPFILRYAPRPNSSEARVGFIATAAKWLKANSDSKIISWESIGLESRQRLEAVAAPLAWHPREIAARKRAILCGTLLAPSDAIATSRDPRAHVTVETKFVYFDHGIGCIECTFKFSPAESDNDFIDLLKDKHFWTKFTDDVCDSVVDRTLGALQPDRFEAITASLTEALARAQCSLEKRPFAGIPKSNLMPVLSTLGLLTDAARVANAAARPSEHLNIMFVLCPGSRSLVDRQEELEQLVTAITGNLPVKGDGRLSLVEHEVTTSDYLDYIFYGAAYSLAIIKQTSPTSDARIAECVGHCFRYLALGYGCLLDASRGLIDRQSAFLADNRTHRREIGEIEKEVLELNRIGALANLVLAEFDPVNFWDTDFEQDIYHRGFLSWAVGDIFAAFRKNLEGFRNSQEYLLVRLNTQYQARASKLLGALAAVTVISAGVDFLGLLNIFDGDQLKPAISSSRLAVSVGLSALTLLLIWGIWATASRLRR